MKNLSFIIIIHIILYSSYFFFLLFFKFPFFHFYADLIKTSYNATRRLVLFFDEIVYIKISCRIQSNDISGIGRLASEISHREFEHHLSDRLPSMTSTCVIARVRAYRSSPQIDRQAGRVGGRCWRT